jgi:hypothetical protein
VTQASEVVSYVSFDPTSELHLEMPAEPKELRDWLRETVLAGGDPRADVSEDVCLGVLLWERWRSSLEPLGMDREMFVDVAESYGRELWLWIIGERLWEQCVEGLVGRVARRIPTS